MLIWCICTLIKLPTFNCEICTFSAKLNFTHDIPLPWKCESGGICSPDSDLTKKLTLLSVLSVLYQYMDLLFLLRFAWISLLYAI